MTFQVDIGRVLRATERVLTHAYVIGALLLAYAYVAGSSAFWEASVQIGIHQAKALEALAEKLGNGV